MSQRFFSESLVKLGRAILDGNEAHHLLHVMRARVGDRVVLFDGSGVEFPAVIEKLGRHEVQLQVEGQVEVDRELGFPLVLAVALPRGERQEWLVQKAVELGVTRLVPWQTERSVALPNAKSLTRLQRTVIEACKQCGRNRLMTIDAPIDFETYLAASSVNSEPSHQWIAHPHKANRLLSELLVDQAPTNDATICLGIGPEGGFTDHEVDLAIAGGWQSVSLGPSILRTETAAIALAALAGLMRYERARRTS